MGSGKLCGQLEGNRRGIVVESDERTVTVERGVERTDGDGER